MIRLKLLRCLWRMVLNKSFSGAVSNLNKPVQITLPRMSFEFVGLQYDASRKVTTTQTFKSHAVGVTTR